jgi:hypothetical protein
MSSPEKKASASPAKVQTVTENVHRLLSSTVVFDTRPAGRLRLQAPRYAAPKPKPAPPATPSGCLGSVQTSDGKETITLEKVPPAAVSENDDSDAASFYDRICDQLARMIRPPSLFCGGKPLDTDSHAYISFTDPMGAKWVFASDIWTHGMMNGNGVITVQAKNNGAKLARRGTFHNGFPLKTTDKLTL